MQTRVIGLAGRPGSGKSAVSRKVGAQDGIEVLDLDRVAWETYERGTPTYERLVGRFGKDLVQASGRIDRAKLAAAALATPKARDDLAAIVHPAVCDLLARRVENAQRRGVRVLLVEGALLATSPYVDRSAFDAILWLEVSDDTRRDRLRAAGREDQTDRLDGLAPDDSTTVIDGEGSVDEVAARIRAAIGQ